MNTNQLLYLSRADVEKVSLDMASIILLLEDAFREKAAGHVEMPPKPGIHTRPEAFIHAMPAYIPALEAAGIKWVSAYPHNYLLGLPYISGLIILNCVDSGLPYAVIDCTWITAYRTGAATALAAKHLACQNSQTVGILACGVQGRTNLEALAVLFPIQRVYAYDINPKAQESYIAEMSAKFAFEFVGVSTPRQAVVESDIVVTSGPIQKHPTPTIEKNWLRPGAFASSVDFGSYWSIESLRQMDKISTDDLAQYQYYKNNGYFANFPEPYADLGELIAGNKPGRENDHERTLAINLGLALEDMAVAPEVYRRAKEKGIGTWLTL